LGSSVLIENTNILLCCENFPCIHCPICSMTSLIPLPPLNWSGRHLPSINSYRPNFPPSSSNVVWKGSVISNLILSGDENSMKPFETTGLFMKEKSFSCRNWTASVSVPLCCFSRDCKNSCNSDGGSTALVMEVTNNNIRVPQYIQIIGRKYRGVLLG